MTLNPLFMFVALTGIYEPSAIQQLPDGRFLVVEDEKQRPFSLVTLHADGSVSSTPLSPGLFQGDNDFWKLDDLEGLTLDQSGNLYALTSHSRDAEGEQKKSRDKLVRFRVEGERVQKPAVSKALKPALLAAHPVLARAAEIRDVKNDGGLNIEALEMSPDQKHLLIGFRSPLLQSRAIIASIDNPSAIFDTGAAPRIAPTLQTLDLAGHGIRGMAWIPALGGYLLISGPVAREQVHFQLWFWRGQPGDAPRRVTAPGVPGFEHAEGASAAVLNGKQYIILVSDDGSRKQNRYARYLLLDPVQLKIAP